MNASRRWVLTGSDARSPMSLDVVAESGPRVSLGARVEVIALADAEKHAWEQANEIRHLREAVADLMRHQAALANALGMNEFHPLADGLVASRDRAKRALGR